LNPESYLRPYPSKRSQPIWPSQISPIAIEVGVMAMPSRINHKYWQENMSAQRYTAMELIFEISQHKNIRKKSNAGYIHHL
jgi:hypothetical protein